MTAAVLVFVQRQIHLVKSELIRCCSTCETSKLNILSCYEICVASMNGINFDSLDYSSDGKVKWNGDLENLKVFISEELGLQGK